MTKAHRCGWHLVDPGGMDILAELADRAQKLARDQCHVIVQDKIDVRISQSDFSFTIGSRLDFKLAFKQHPVGKLKMKDRRKSCCRKTVFLSIRARYEINVAKSGHMQLGQRIEIVALYILPQCRDLRLKVGNF